MRMLGPTQLGIGAFVLSFVAQVAVFGSFGLNITGIRAMVEHPLEQKNIISIICAFRLRLSLVLSVTMVLLVWLLHLPGSLTIWALAIPFLFLSVLAPHWIFQGIERVPVLNTIELVQAVFTILLYFALFRPGARAELYVSVALLAQMLGWTISYAVLSQHLRIDWWRMDWHVVWDWVRLSRYAFAIILTTFAYTSLDIPLVTLLLSPKDAGIYRAAQATAGVIAPILAMLPLIIYPRLIAWKNQGNRVFIRNSLILIAYLSGFALLLSLSSLMWVPIAFRVLLGPQYAGGIWPGIILVIAKSVALVGSVPTWGVLAFGLDRVQLQVTLVAAAISLSLNLLLIPTMGLIIASGMNVVSELIVALLSGTALLKFLRYS